MPSISLQLLSGARKNHRAVDIIVSEYDIDFAYTICRDKQNDKTNKTTKTERKQKMKKIMIVAAGAMAFSAIAQEVEVPAPVAVPAPVVVAVPSTVAVAYEVEPGALCKTYLIRWNYTVGIGQVRACEIIEDALTTAVPVDQQYDDKAMVFDGKKVASPKHDYTVAVWDGMFVAKRPGMYVFTVDAYAAYGIKVNGTGVHGVGQNSFVVELQKGCNTFRLYRYIPKGNSTISTNSGTIYKVSDFSLDYRLATSTKPAKPITPSMLMHIVEEEEEW